MNVDISGTVLIAEERLRQVAQEGWTGAHDDGHTGTELAQAAFCYIREAQYTINKSNEDRERCGLLNWKNEWYWPWEEEWWKPSDDPIRNLVKAGALIAAEIDRLQRFKALAARDRALRESRG